MSDEKDIVIRIKADNLTGPGFGATSKGLVDIKDKAAQIRPQLVSVGEVFRSTFATAAIAGTAIVGTVTAITAGLTALGLHGADVGDVSDQFRVLADEIDLSADTLGGKLRSAFAGTVTDFELMKSTNHALSQGLKLNEEQFGLTGRAARVLADRVGGDAKSAYDVLLQAMATGNDRTLKSIGLNIDGAAAVETMAKALGRQASELNESQQIAAKKNAILGELQRTLKISGDAEVDFGDRVSQVRTFLANTYDELAKGIAQSSVFSAGLGAAGDAIAAAFGGSQSTLVQTLVHWMERIAIAAVDGGLVLLEWGRTGAQIFGALQVPVRAITVGFVDLTSTMANALATIAEMSARVPGVGSQFQGLAASARSTASTWNDMSAGAHQLLADAIALAKGQGTVHAAFDKVSNVLVTMKSRMEAATLAQQAQTQKTEQHARAANAASTSTDGLSKAQEAAQKKFLDSITYFNTADAGLANYARTASNAGHKAILLAQGLDENETVLVTSTPLWVAYGDAVDDSGERIRALITTQSALRGALQNIGTVILGAVQGGGSVSASIGSSLGQAIGTDLKAKLAKSLEGASGLLGTLGSAFSNMLPGLGALLGPALGALTSGFKKLFGIGINEEVKKANAEIKTTIDQLIKSKGNVDELEKSFQSVGLSIRENLGHQGKEGLRQLNELIDDYNKRIAEAEQRTRAIKSASDQALTGFAALVAGITAPYDAVATRVKAAQDEVDKLREKMRDAEHVSTDMTRDMERAQAKLTESLAVQHGLAEGAKQTLADLGTVAMATFAAQMLAGKSFSEAMAAAGPGLADLRKAYADLGLDIEDVGLKHLLLGATVQEQQPALMSAVSALGTSMQALAQLGLLNADTFGAMERTGSTMYARLQGEVAALGGDTRDALLPMQGYLQQAARQAELLGIPLDGNTAMLIEQSKELGIWQDVGKSASDKLIEGMAELLAKISEMLDKTLGVSGALAAIPARVDSDIYQTFHEEHVVTYRYEGGGPKGDPPFAEGTKDVTGSWFPNFSSTGTRVIVHADEAIVPRRKVGEFIQDMGAGRAAAAAGPVNVFVVVDPTGLNNRQVSEGEFRQIQNRLNTRGLTVPVHAITQRGLA